MCTTVFIENDLFSVTLGLVPTGSLVGIVYGGLFTVYPTLVLLVWGERSFGTVYGSLLIAPAIGSMIFCMLYAKFYDSRCMSGGGDLRNPSCISAVYKYSSIAFVVSAVLSTVVFWKLKVENSEFKQKETATFIFLKFIAYINDTNKLHLFLLCSAIVFDILLKVPVKN